MSDSDRSVMNAFLKSYQKKIALSETPEKEAFEHLFILFKCLGKDLTFEINDVVITVYADHNFMFIKDENGNRFVYKLDDFITIVKQMKKNSSVNDTFMRIFDGLKFFVEGDLNRYSIQYLDNNILSIVLDK